MKHRRLHWILGHNQECERMRLQMTRKKELQSNDLHLPFKFQNGTGLCSWLAGLHCHMQGAWTTACVCSEDEAKDVGPDASLLSLLPSARDLWAGTQEASASRVYLQSLLPQFWHLPSPLVPCAATQAAPGPVCNWGDYYRHRGVPLSSPLALLMDSVLTVYGGLCKLQQLAGGSELFQGKDSVVVHYLGAQKEVPLWPLFLELGALLPAANLHLHFIGPHVPDSAHSRSISVPSPTVGNLEPSNDLRGPMWDACGPAPGASSVGDSQGQGVPWHCTQQAAQEQVLSDGLQGVPHQRPPNQGEGSMGKCVVSPGTGTAPCSRAEEDRPAGASCEQGRQGGPQPRQHEHEQDSLKARYGGGMVMSWHQGLYHDVAPELVKRQGLPQLVVGPNAGLVAYASWLETMQIIIQNIRCKSLTVSKQVGQSEQQEEECRYRQRDSTVAPMVCLVTDYNEEAVYRAREMCASLLSAGVTARSDTSTRCQGVRASNEVARQSALLPDIPFEKSSSSIQRGDNDAWHVAMSEIEMNSFRNPSMMHMDDNVLPACSNAFSLWLWSL